LDLARDVSRLCRLGFQFAKPLDLRLDVFELPLHTLARLGSDLALDLRALLRNRSAGWTVLGWINVDPAVRQTARLRTRQSRRQLRRRLRATAAAERAARRVDDFFPALLYDRNRDGLQASRGEGGID